MKVTKIVWVTATILTVVSAGAAVYSKVKTNKIKMDENIDPEVKDELVKKAEKVTDVAIKTVTTAGTVCAWSWAIFMLRKNTGISNININNIPVQNEIKTDVVRATRDFLRSINDKFIVDMTEHGVNMHGLTGQSNVDDAFTVYRECYDNFIKTHGTGGDFVNDLADMLNIHSIFVRNDLANAMTGGVLYE